jgi:hypothetical protein
MQRIIKEYSMRIQFVLTPTESKKLLSKAVVEMGSFQRALKAGTIVIHPSSTTVFILSELGFQLDPEALWICGLTVPRGLCASAQILEEVYQMGKFDPQKYTHSWVMRKGKWVKERLILKEMLSELKEGDLYIKSPNSIDPEGKTGVLYSATGAGTVGLVMKAQRKQGFEIVLPTGLEKMINRPVKEVSKESPKHAMNFCTGTPCGLMPIEGTVITELEAVSLLSGAQAFLIAAGGVGGAEGGLVMTAKGDKAQITKAAEILGSVKGARLPKLNLLECNECKRTKCHLSPVFDSGYIPEGGWIVPESYKTRVRKQ